MRFRVTLEYDGSDFVGWQRQPDRRSVQGTVEEALATVTSSPTTVVGAGRTDAGVHARGQVAHFDASWSRSEGELQKAMNAVLPWDVAVRNLDTVIDTFHARYSAEGRRYQYHIWNGAVRTPLGRRRSWHVPGALDLAAMAAAGREMQGRHDFRAFGKAPRPGGATVRDVKAVALMADGPRLTFSVQANAFLRHQVRRMVGLLVEVGRGRVSPAEVAHALESGVPVAGAKRAPAQGLVLEAVFYPVPFRHRSASQENHAPRTTVRKPGSPPAAAPELVHRGSHELEVLR